MFDFFVEMCQRGVRRQLYPVRKGQGNYCFYYYHYNKIITNDDGNNNYNKLYNLTVTFIEVNHIADIFWFLAIFLRYIFIKQSIIHNLFLNCYIFLIKNDN